MWGFEQRQWESVSTMPDVYFPSLSVILQSWKAEIILGKSNLLKLCPIRTQGSCFCIKSTNKARASASWYVLTRWPWQNKPFPGKVKPLISRNASAISLEFPKVRKWPSCYIWPVMSDALWEIGFVGVMWQSKLSLSLTAAIWKISASLCRDVVSMSQNIFLTYDHPNGFTYLQLERDFINHFLLKYVAFSDYPPHNFSQFLDFWFYKQDWKFSFYSYLREVIRFKITSL